MVKEFSRTYWPPLLDTLIISFFTLQPTLYLAMGYWIKLEQYPMKKPLLSGDILLYSVSYLSASFLVYNQFRVKESDWKDNMNKIIFLMIIAISGLVVTMRAKEETTSIIFAKWASIVFGVTAIIIFFKAQLLVRKPTTDVAAVRREEQQDIADSLS